MRVGALTVESVYDGYGDQIAREILHGVPKNILSIIGMTPDEFRKLL